ncbi:MAG: helix-turn-helix domain-containing protein [Christensenellales bacterium]
MTVSSTFKKRICSLVNESEKSRTELREILKISSTSFTNSLIYGIVPTPKTLIKIADYFEVTIAFLLGKEDVNNFIRSSTPKTFCERLTELCNQKGISHYKVAQDCLFDKSLISRWFNKGYLPSLEILEILSEYFKVSEDYILGRTDYKA